MNINEYTLQSEALLKKIELKITSLDDSAKLLEQDRANAKKDIEVHFIELKDALDARKATLFAKADKLYQEQKEKITVLQQSMREFVGGCKAMMKAVTNNYLYSLDYARANLETITIFERGWKEVHKISSCINPNLIGQISSYNDVQLFHSSAGNVSRFAGSGSDQLVDGKGVKSGFSNPKGMCICPLDDCLYICDSGNNMIRKITQKGEVTQFAGKKGGNELVCPHSIAFHENEKKFFVIDRKLNCIKKIALTGVIEDFVGGTNGYKDGIGTATMFKNPYGIAINQKSGDIYVSDSDNHCIRKITTAGQVTTLAGSLKHGYADGVGANAQFYSPKGIVFSKNEEVLFVCDFVQNFIRAIHLKTNDVKTITEFDSPDEIVALVDGSILVSSAYRQRKLFRIDIGNETTRTTALVGSGYDGSEIGAPHKSSFYRIDGLLFDPKTNICYISTGHSILKFPLAL